MVLRRPETSATNGFFFNLFNVFMSKKHVHHVFMSKNMYIMSKYDICISNAQYSSLSAQQNLCAKFLSFEQL